MQALLEQLYLLNRMAVRDLQYSVIDELYKLTDKNNVLCNEPMKFHTTFKIGGPADFFVTPVSSEEFVSILKFCSANNIECTVLGNGSNVLVSDKGIRGVVISTLKLNKISVEGNRIIAESGVSLAKVAAVALENSLTGFEFASGIPGSLGGAVVMNAGAYGGEIKDVVAKTTCCDINGEIHIVFGDGHEFAYRKSYFSDKQLYILSSEIVLSKGDKNEIFAVMKDLNARRLEKQPLNFPSAGSTFKRPVGYFAAKLIDDSGLRGRNVNDAFVSEKHCGFVVNKGDATANDVLNLINICKKTVKEKFNVEIEPEVKFLGEY